MTQRLSGRVVALTLVAIAASIACVLLAMWQWGRASDVLEAERAAASAPIPLVEVLVDGELPATSIGRTVIAEGAYADADQLVVAQRGLGDRAGVWVVAPLATEAGTLAVVRGWLESPDSPGLEAPAGPVRVEGVLQGFEGFYGDLPRRADGQLVAIARGALEEAWGTPVLPGLVVLQSQQPATSPAPEPVPPTVPRGEVPFPLQNAAYTLQWFVFAGFVWVMWWLWLRRDRVADGEPADRLEE
ncbi:MAG: SURF1 family protein [bacterium]